MTDHAVRKRWHEHADSEHGQEYADYVENRPNHFRRSHFVLEYRAHDRPACGEAGMFRERQRLKETA
jgi:hypothetical protein